MIARSGIALCPNAEWAFQFERRMMSGEIMVMPCREVLQVRKKAIAEGSDFALISTDPGGPRLFDNGADRLAPRRSISKRTIDIFGALIGLVFFCPLMMILYALIRLDGGPALYSQMRVGANGKLFRCWKFRSMVTDAEARLQRLLETDAAARTEWEQEQKLSNDPRITTLGKFIRVTSLDELPQFVNVLKGEMSLIGPRPIIEDEIKRYGDYFFHYQACRPGITGAWQVSGRNDVSYDERVQLDRDYAVQWSLVRDIEILMKTFAIVALRTGAR